MIPESELADIIDFILELLASQCGSGGEYSNYSYSEVAKKIRAKQEELRSLYL